MLFWYTILFQRKKKSVIENLFLLFEVIARKHVGTQDTLAREDVSLQGTLTCKHLSRQDTLAREQVRMRQFSRLIFMRSFENKV